MSKIRKIILAGLLLATMLVLGRFLSIKTPILQISFSFIPTILVAMLLGPWFSMALSVLNDLIGALLFPFGAYFWGYTLTALVSGAIYGFILKGSYKKTGKQFIWRLVLACVLTTLVCNVGMNTLWIYLTTKKAIVVLLPARLPSEAIMLAIKIVVMFGLHMALLKLGAYRALFKNEYLAESEDQSTQIENNLDKKAQNDDKNGEKI